MRQIIISLDVWLEHYPQPVGRLNSYADESIDFIYSDAYVEVAKNAIPLSLSMPMDTKSYGDVVSRTYFGNLLQENSQLDYIRDKYSIPANDIVGLLYHLGADLPGAVSCVPVESEPVKRPGVLARDYDALLAEGVDAIVESLHHKRRLPDGTKDPSPLAGVQRKYALCYDQGADQFYSPKTGSRVPTTHIIKVPDRSNKRDVVLEETAMRLAEAVGFDAASVEARKTVNDIPYLLIERFDRVIEDGKIYRLHQEDIAQALAIPARFKYERENDGRDKYSAQTIQSVLMKTEVPAQAVEEFLKLTFFNLAIGNNDNHAKNHSLLYLATKPMLAPVYDVLPILLNDQYTKELAFKIGNASTITEISYADIITFFAVFKISEAAAVRFMKQHIQVMYQAIFEKMTDVGLAKDFRDLIGACIQHLSSELSLDIQIPDMIDYYPLEERDQAWRVS